MISEHSAIGKIVDQIKSEVSIIGDSEMANHAIVVTIGDVRMTQEQMAMIREAIRNKIGDDLCNRLVLVRGRQIDAVR